MSDATKAVVTVAEMARMVGLSRSRFYQLIHAGVFPCPVYNVSTRRPIYVEEMQEVCLEVRRRNCGINGKPVLFYSRGHRLESRPRPKVKQSLPKSTPQYNELIDSLRTLGLVAIRPDQVEAAVKHLYPGGTNGTAQGEVIRAVFLHLRRQDSAGNVGR